MAEYRILALDGGGPWALLQVMALNRLYSSAGDGTDITGHDVLRKFDLIAANSGGTLALGGLILNWKLADILNTFLNPTSRARIFVPASFLDDPIAHLTQLVDFGPKYSTKGKYAGLRSMLGTDGDKHVTTVPGTIGSGYNQNPVHVVFCAFNYDTNREVFFRSNTASLAASFAPPPQVTIAQAIHASANPPINYFDAPADLPQHTRYWDGAVGGYNNPVLAAVTEALANGADRSSIKALSLGTGNVVLPPALGQTNEDPDLTAPRQASTMLSDVKKMASSILDDPPDAATFHAHVVLGGEMPQRGSSLPVDSAIVRMNPLIQPEKGAGDVPWVLPQGMSRDDFRAIRDLPMDATKQDDIDRIRAFGEMWIAGDIRNQPIRANTVTLDPEIGDGRFQFAEAKARARFS
jgi:hypothetical protein